MTTPLGNCFSTTEYQVPQYDIGSTAETMVIHFDQEKLEQFLCGGSTNPLHVRKHLKVSIARAPLATSWMKVSLDTTKALCEPTTVSCEAKKTLLEFSTVSTETNIASHQRANAACEAKLCDELS